VLVSVWFDQLVMFRLSYGKFFVKVVRQPLGRVLVIFVKVVRQPLDRAICMTTLDQPLFNELIFGLGSFSSLSN
jgi:hypothetical protein